MVIREYIYKADPSGGFNVLGVNQEKVAHVPVEADAKEIVASLNLVTSVVARWPGFLPQNAGEDMNCNGGDLVEFIGECIKFDEEGRFAEPAKA